MNKNGIMYFRSKLVGAIITLICLCSCSERYIFEGEGDCGVYHCIRFKYDYNMKFANAFANEVNSLSLYMFDDNNILVQKIDVDDKAVLSSDTFNIVLEPAPGNYQLLALGGMQDETSFKLIADAKIGETTLEEMQVKSKLLEHVAYRILRTIKSKWSEVSHGEVSITKLSPPIDKFSGKASVKIIF